MHPVGHEAERPRRMPLGARRGQRQALRVLANKKLNAELPLQVGNRGRNRRLGNAHALCRARHAAGLARGDKVAELPECKPHSASRPQPSPVQSIFRDAWCLLLGNGLQFLSSITSRQPGSWANTGHTPCRSAARQRGALRHGTCSLRGGAPPGANAANSRLG